MRVNSIQFLRTVAVLLVVYEHSLNQQNDYGKSWQQTFYHLWHFGCIGVDLFFVISGFIITYVAANNNGIVEGKLFLRRRFYRIVPVYYIATGALFAIILAQLIINHITWEKVSVKLLNSLVDSALVVPIVADSKTFSPLLIVGWTLSFEWLFYILFSFLIIFNVKRKTYALPCLIFILIFIGQLIKPSDFRIQFITNPIMLEFVLGVLICHIYLNKTKIANWLSASLLTIGLITYMLLIRYGYGDVWYYLNTLTGMVSFNRFFLWGIPSACIVAGCVLLEKNGCLTKLVTNRWILLLGDASYSIYLIHYVFFNGLRIIYAKNKFIQGDIIIWLQAFAALTISVCFYKLVEKPLLGYFIKKIKSSNLKTADNERSKQQKKIFST